MVAAVVSLLWHQVPSIHELTRMLNRKDLLWAKAVSVSRQALSQRFLSKRSQYAAIGVPEYWLIGPSTQTVAVLELQDDDYQEVGTFRDGDRIASPTFPELTLTANQVFQS